MDSHRKPTCASVDVVARQRALMSRVEATVGRERQGVGRNDTAIMQKPCHVLRKFAAVQSHPNLAPVEAARPGRRSRSALPPVLPGERPLSTNWLVPSEGGQCEFDDMPAA